MSIPSPSRIHVLTRSTRPYISLDDPATQGFFTKDHVRNHLRRAGLINKQGEILTEAEYASKQTDVAIGRENHRKIEDAITEVLKDMAREHWAYSREYTEALRKDLVKQFQRIENQYRRRIQPITIRYSSNGGVLVESVKQITDPPSDGSENYGRLSAEKFPPVRSDRSSHPSLERQSTNLRNIWGEINNMKDRLTSLNRESNTQIENDGSGFRVLEDLIINLTKKYDSLQEQQNIFFSKRLEEDNGQTASSNQISVAIEELNSRILILETSFHSNTNVNDIHLTRNDPRHEQEGNILRSPIHESDNSGRLSQPQLATRVNSARGQDFGHSSNGIPSFHDLESIQERLTALENSPYNSNDNLITTLENLVEENFKYFKLLEDRIDDLGRKKLEREEITRIRDSIDKQCSQGLELHYHKIIDLLEGKSNHQQVLQLLDNNKEQTNQKFNELNRSLADNQRALKDTENYITDLYRQLNLQSKTTSNEVAKQNLEESPVPDKPTSEELQTIMPFAEFLSTFDMSNENE